MVNEDSDTAATARPPKPTAPPPLIPVRAWPSDEVSGMSRATLLAATATGLVGAVALVTTTSIGLVVTGIAIFAAVFGNTRTRRQSWQVVSALGCCALLGVGTFRSASWLVDMCVGLAWAVGSVALVGGRSWSGLALGSFALWLAPARALRWVMRGVARMRLRGVSSVRVAVVGSLTLVLTVVFAALFASADAAYAHVLNDVIPYRNSGYLVGRIFVFCCVTAETLIAIYVATRPPVFDELAPGPGRTRARWEWVIPLAALDILFASFVAVETTVLFGGEQHVLATRGLTYAEYARQSFWQLLAVTLMALLIVAVAVRKAARASKRDRALVRLLLGSLCALTLVIVASALHRMSVYEQHYGFTRLRLFVETFELWLGVIFVLLLIAGIRLTSRWLPRTVLASAVLALLALAWLNPDAYIARHDVDRYDKTRRVDVAYLAGLSPDAVPALERLPEPIRSCALDSLRAQLLVKEPWYEFNLGRSRARHHALAAPPIDAGKVATSCSVGKPLS